MKTLRQEIAHDGGGEPPEDAAEEPEGGADGDEDIAQVVKKHGQGGQIFQLISIHGSAPAEIFSIITDTA